jgi:hypothetical protein
LQVTESATRLDLQGRCPGVEYTSDGEVRQEFSIVFTAKPTGGEATTSDEASEVIWADPSEVGDMGMHPSMRQRIDHFRAARAEPYLG